MKHHHNSQIADRERPWESVIIDRLPRCAFAFPGRVNEPTSWEFAHHWVDRPGKAGKTGLYEDGTLYLHRAALDAAWEAFQSAAARGVPLVAPIGEHLQGHREDLGLTAEERNVRNRAIPSDVPDWIEIVTTGKWEGHPAGPEVINRHHLQAALDAFTRDFIENESELVVDYHHQSLGAGTFGFEARAAGWIRAIELRENSLWAQVEWTENAREAIGAREFRYLSPVLSFNQPDRVTGKDLPMQIHSVALTNTPFMTELAALNERFRPSGSGDDGPKPNTAGDVRMDFLKMLATLLKKDPEELKNELGLESTDDGAVAAHLMGLSGQITTLTGKVSALEAQVAKPPESAAVNSAIAGALGVDPASDETAVMAKILQMQAGTAQHSVALKLGLEAGSDNEAILTKIGELQVTQNEADCEALVANAISAGKVPPAQKDFWLDNAKRNPAAARMALNSMPTVVSNDRVTGTPKPGDRSKPPLSAEDREVMKQLGLTEDQFLAQKAE